MIIGITGSSGAGKSTVCEILEDKYKVKVINADKIAKKLSKRNNCYLNDIVEQFGIEILLENGELNRPKLAKIIYTNSEKREMLNQCTFKYIREEIQNKIVELIDEDIETIIAIDAPLLFEAGLEELCQFVIAVISDDRTLQIKRIVKRDGITEVQASERLNAQKHNEFYIEKSDYIIVNNGELKEVEKQIEEILKEIK